MWFPKPDVGKQLAVNYNDR